MTDFRQKIWAKLYYKTRLSNSREDSQRVANEAVEDFDKMFSDSTQTLKQAFPALPFEERFEESTNPMDKSIKSSDLFKELMKNRDNPIMHEKFEKKEHIIKWVYDPECGCDRCDKID